MIGSVFKAEIEARATEKLGIIGIQVEDKKTKEKKIAKAPSDYNVEKGENYVIGAWNFRYAQCPMCVKKKQGKCKLCEGEGKILTFSYVIKKQGEEMGEPWKEVNKEKMREVIQKEKKDWLKKWKKK